MWGARTSDAKFFGAFTEHAGITVQAAATLVELFQHPERGEACASRIEELEHQGDRVVHDTFTALRATWITPFDRTDIRRLVARLDDVLDLINATAKRFHLFELDEVRDEPVEFAEDLLMAANTMKAAVSLLSNLKRSEEIMKHCELLNEIENRGDARYRRVIARLYKKGNDPLEALKWREVVDNLEFALDRCEDVADVISGVVLEYS